MCGSGWLVVRLQRKGREALRWGVQDKRTLKRKGGSLQVEEDRACLGEDEEPVPSGGCDAGSEADHLHSSTHFSMCDFAVLSFCPLKIGVKITSATVPALRIDYMDNNRPGFWLCGMLRHVSFYYRQDHSRLSPHVTMFCFRDITRCVL